MNEHIEHSGALGGDTDCNGVADGNVVNGQRAKGGCC